MNTVQKKEWLNRYRRWYYICLDCRDELKDMAILSSSKLSLTPKGKGNHSTVEELTEDRLDVEEELYKAKLKLNKVHKEISNALSQLEDEKEYRILRLTHLNLLSDAEIAERMNISESSVRRIYRSGLVHLIINNQK